MFGDQAETPAETGGFAGRRSRRHATWAGDQGCRIRLCAVKELDAS